MRLRSVIWIVIASAFTLGLAGSRDTPRWKTRETPYLSALSPEIPAADTRLLFITLDGVRPDEFNDCEFPLAENCSFPLLWKAVHDGGFQAFPMETGNTRRMSLPGYHSIYGGVNLDSICLNNTECVRAPQETWLEVIQAKYKLKPQDVAVISSWQKIELAAEKKPGSLYTNCGIEKMKDPRTGEIPAELKSASESQVSDRPHWENARLDRYTVDYARWYLKSIQPKVMVLGLLDSDELAHQDRYEDYRAKLREYDRLISEIVNDLRDRGLLEKTIIAITTDHGRGSGYFGYTFRGHGWHWVLEHSKHTWFAISVPQGIQERWKRLNEPFVKGTATQLDIRPLMLGLLSDR